MLTDSHFLDQMNAEIICQNLVSLNLAGIGATMPEFNAYAEALTSDINFVRLSTEERIVLDQICRKEINALGADNPAASALAALQKRITELA